MTTHAAAFESITARHPGTATSRPDSGWSDYHPVIPFGVTPATQLVPRSLVPISGYSAVPVLSADVVDVGDTTIYTRATNNAFGLQATDTQGEGEVISNVTAFFRKGTFQNSAFNSGRLSPRIYLDFNGLNQSANQTALSATLQYAYRDNPYFGLCHFCEFEEWPPDSETNPDTRLRQLLNLFHQGTSSYQVGVDGSGNAIVANYCGFAALAPEGAVIVRPEDIGTGPDQIPTDGADNEASKFRAHPSVFYPAGKAPYVRSLFRQAVDTIGLAQGQQGGPLEITTVDSAPTSSNWLVVVDGQAQILELIHPQGSDYRRPRDIWNNVWVPIITGNNSAAGAVTFGGAVSTGGSIGFNWAYADYFRCLPLPGTNIVQDGIG